MKRNDLISLLDELDSSLMSLRKVIRQTNKEFISSSEIKLKSKNICLLWIEKIKLHLPQFMPMLTIIETYDSLFDKLLHLSTSRTSRKNTYMEVIASIRTKFRKDIILPVIKSSDKNGNIGNLERVYRNVMEEEKEYLKEAIGCAKSGFYRASIVLGWCAAVSRMHKVVEKKGLEDFNRKSVEMNKIKSGRYKRFNKSFNLQTASELEASVFDNDLLWVFEYWGIIDSNQHERLQICFTMRNNSAHPGDIGISMENLLSFYSDIEKIVFDNNKFAI